MSFTTSRRALAIELAAAALILRYGAKRVGKWINDRQYDGLEGMCGSSKNACATPLHAHVIHLRMCTESIMDGVQA